MWHWNTPEAVTSKLLKRYNKKLSEDIKSINEKLQHLCTSKGLSYTDNTNIVKSCLNGKVVSE